MSTKESTNDMSKTASELMQLAKGGGPLRALRTILLTAMTASIARPKHYPAAVTDDERRLDAIELALKPYVDKAESLAGSVLSQDTTPGDR